MAFLFSFSVKAGHYKTEYDSSSCLQIEGKISNCYEGDSECLVELIDEEGVQQSLLLKEGKIKFKFVLRKDKVYGIRISKTGFVSKLISVNTEMLIKIEGIAIFNFETSLLSEEVAGKLNQDILDFPVAIIHFDYEQECFSYNMEYTSYIKRETYKTRIEKGKKIAKPLYVLDQTNLAVQ